MCCHSQAGLQGAVQTFPQMRRPAPLMPLVHQCRCWQLWVLGWRSVPEEASCLPGKLYVVGSSRFSVPAAARPSSRCQWTSRRRERGGATCARRGTRHATTTRGCTRSPASGSTPTECTPPRAAGWVVAELLASCHLASTNETCCIPSSAACCVPLGCQQPPASKRPELELRLQIAGCPSPFHRATCRCTQ